MTPESDGELWRRFGHDPRDPAYAGMRATDRDRAVVHDVLAAAYADGRLDREELDERVAQVDRAKTYGDLVPPLADLAPDAALPVVTVESRAELEQVARAQYREELAEAYMAVLVPNLVCWAIWYMTGHDSFIWPIFVLIPTLGNLVRVAAGRQSTIDARVRKLQGTQAKALDPPRSSDG